MLGLLSDSRPGKRDGNFLCWWKHREPLWVRVGFLAVKRGWKLVYCVSGRVCIGFRVTGTELVGK